MDKDYNELEGRLTISKDTTLRQLFGGKDENYSICYFDDNSEYLEQVENLNTLQFRFSIPYGSNNEREVYDNNYLETEISSLYEDVLVLIFCPERLSVLLSPLFAVVFNKLLPPLKSSATATTVTTFTPPKTVKNALFLIK